MDTTKLFSFIPVWMALIFMQDHSKKKKKKKA